MLRSPWRITWGRWWISARSTRTEAGAVIPRRTLLPWIATTVTQLSPVITIFSPTFRDSTHVALPPCTGVWAPQADRAPRRNLTPTREQRGRAPPTAAQPLRQPGGAGTRGKGCWSSSRTWGEERTSYSARLMSARSEGVWGRGRHQEWRVTRPS